MLLWGVETRELYSLQLTSRFTCFDAWTKVSWQQPDLLLTNAMSFIESPRTDGPRLPPRRLNLAAAGAVAPDHRLSTPERPGPPPVPAPAAKTPRSTAANGRRHRKKEFQMLPSRARCEVSLQFSSISSILLRG